MKNYGKMSGFTLVEMMIVVAIIGILAVIAVPAYNDYIEKGELADAKQAATAMYQSFESNRLAAPRDFTTQAQYETQIRRVKDQISKRITKLYQFNHTIAKTNDMPTGFSLEVRPIASGKKYYMRVDAKGNAERCKIKGNQCEKF